MDVVADAVDAVHSQLVDSLLVGENDKSHCVIFHARGAIGFEKVRELFQNIRIEVVDRGFLPSFLTAILVLLG